MPPLFLQPKCEFCMVDSKKENKIEDAAISGAAYETTQRYGSSIKEHFVAFSGVDNEIGIALKKGLKKISTEKLNPDYIEQNLKQQSGYAAEVKYTARENAEHIINGDSTRVINTDIKGSGSYNELFDHIITKDGVVVSQEQMKFVGNDVKECVGKLLSPKFQKYRDNNAVFTLPSDYFEPDANGIPKIQNEVDRRILETKRSIDSGKLPEEVLKKKQQDLKELEKLKENVKNSKLSKQEAIEARLHPEWSTAKDVLKLSHRAGLEQAKIGAAIGGSVSIVRNIVSVVNGDKTVTDAVLSVVKDTATVAAVSYGTGVAGSLIKASMQNSGSAVFRGLSKSNLPAAIVSLSIDSAKTLRKFFNGDISGLECLENLGETGTGMISSAMFATVGQVLIPIPVVGAMAGSMIGYALSSSCYGLLVGALKEEKLAREERIRIEKECEEHIKNLKEYRAQLEKYFDDYMTYYKNNFREAFKQIKTAYEIGDCDGYLDGCDKIITALGGTSQYSTVKEFEELMDSDEPIKF